MASLSDLLDLARPAKDLQQLYSAELLERVEIFRRTWQRLATRHPVVRVLFVYATKGDSGNINDKVFVKADRLAKLIADKIPGGATEARFLGARELVDLAGREKSYTLKLSFVENATADESHVALVTLDDYFSFITDEAGNLRKYIFDWNVRDYEGAVEVNKEMASSLASVDAPEFWWMNNGVTVICSQASAQGKTFSLDDVQIVNGLQTSVTVFGHLSQAAQDDPARARSILVRVIVTEDHGVRDKVIRATNRQTAVPVASLRATDQIQRDLEKYFLNEDWFYERRKNYYRNQGKTPARIVTIPYLAQAMMAIGLSEPSNSRARPSSLLKRDADYQRIFDDKIDYATFLWAAQVQKAVDDFLRSSSAAAPASERTNLRFHVSMLLVASAHGARVYSPAQLTELVGTTFDDPPMLDALTRIRSALASFQRTHRGAIDQTAKGREFSDYVLEREFPTRLKAESRRGRRAAK
jgi:hypothetical protein